MGETSTLACLFGAILLIVTGIGSWRIMAGVLMGSLATAGLFYVFRESSDNPMYQMPPHWHLVVGGLAFGLVFMATDPVSAAMTESGKWVFGGLIGGLTILIRNINPGYPEGIMLAILFANVCAPLIDYAVVRANIRRRLARSAL
jgi:Na+-transporting NADH:ubiquinone oxidoreductase subunit B